MEKFFISIIIPVFNEAETISEVVTKIGQCVNGAGFEHEIIIVNDGSSDNTWDIINHLSKVYKEIRAIKFSRNFGKESAVTAGLEVSTGDAVIVMDGDLQHPPDLIPKMIDYWKRGGCDIVEAVKADRGKEPLFVKVGAKFFYWLMKNFTDLDIAHASDFKLLDRKVVEAHNRLPEKTRFFRGLVSWLGFKRIQIPFSVLERKKGRSKWSLSRLVKLAINGTTSFTSFPLHLITVIGALTLLFNMIMAIQTLYMKISGHAVSGFTTVILLILFIGSILMLSLGIIGLYISRIFEEVKGRPTFIIEESINLQEKT
jgi:dolichol-phosphate mannosyltransferase